MNDKWEILWEFITLNNILKRYADSSNAKKYADKLTGTNGWVIGFMYKNRDRDVFQRDLEEAFSVRRSTISNILKLMEQKELIRREGVDYDGRLKRLVLTEKALKIQEMMDDHFKCMSQMAFENLTDEEIETFRKTLKKIRKNFDENC